MNDATLDPAGPPGTIRLRPERPDDERFLFDVYASTRQEELDRTGWDAATRAAFLELQFKAMRQGYRAMFPAAEFAVILLAGQPVGRQVVDRTGTEIRLVDVALLPSHRGRGVGTILLRQLLGEAARRNTPVRLHVLKTSRAARLYERVGFCRVGEAGFYDCLEWKPATVGP